MSLAGKVHLKPPALILAQKFNDDVYVILLLDYTFPYWPGCGSWSELPSWTRRSGSSRPRKRNLARWETAWRGEKQLGGVRNSLAGWETAWRGEKQLGEVRNSLAVLRNSLAGCVTDWQGEKQLDGVRNSLARWEYLGGVRNSLARWEIAWRVEKQLGGMRNSLAGWETAWRGEKQLGGTGLCSEMWERLGDVWSSTARRLIL